MSTKRAAKKGQDPVTGKFTKGNKIGAHKGHRPGKKPNAMRQALDELLNSPVKGDTDNRTLVGVAMDTLYKALGAQDEFGQPNAVALQAARDILDRQFGKARQTVQVARANDQDLIHALDQAEVEEVRRIGDLKLVG